MFSATMKAGLKVKVKATAQDCVRVGAPPECSGKLGEIVLENGEVVVRFHHAMSVNGKSYSDRWAFPPHYLEPQL